MENSNVNLKRRNVKQDGKVDLSWGLHVWFPRLPNITKFYLKEGELNSFWWEFFIEKTEREMDYVTLDSNDKANKYALHMLRRLDYLHRTGEHAKYWAIAWRLMKYSSVFFSLSLRHVHPTWYKDWSLGKVNSIIRLYRKKLETLEFHMSRTYIPKAQGGFRPLGVPGIVDRLVQANFAKFLWWTLKEDIPRYQHAYQPLKGVLTAWYDVFNNLLTAENIWGFDLKKAFDRIFRKALERPLFKAGVLGSYKSLEDVIKQGHHRLTQYANPSNNIISYEVNPNYLPEGQLQNFNMLNGLFNQTISYRDKKEHIERELRKVEIEKGTLINSDPPKSLGKTLHYESFPSAWSWKSGSSSAPFKNDLWPLKEVTEKPIFDLERKVVWEKIQGNWVSIPRYSAELVDQFLSKRNLKDQWILELCRRNLDPIWQVLIGVPQGGNVSPILFIAGLKEFYRFIEEKGWKAVFYADDGLITCEDERELLQASFTREGINFNEDKCEWIKRKGIWLKELKFLGLIYNPWLNKLFSISKDGKRFAFNVEDILEALVHSRKSLLYKFRKLMRANPSFTHRDEKWMILQASQAFGFVYSRIIANSWLPEHVSRRKDGKPKVINLVWDPKSWMGVLGSKINGINLHNASSYAHASLFKLLGKIPNNKTRNWKLKFANVLWESEHVAWSEPTPDYVKEFFERIRRGEVIDLNSKLGKFVMRYNIKLHENVRIKSENITTEEKTSGPLVIRKIKVGKLERNRVFNPNLIYARGSLGTLMPIKYLNLEEIDLKNLDWDYVYSPPKWSPWIRY